MGYFDDLRGNNIGRSVAPRPSDPAGQPPANGQTHPYAAAAIRAELTRLDQLTRPWHEGAGWDTTTYEVACNLIELANSPWSGYTRTDAENDLHTHAPTDNQWGTRQVDAKWRSAAQKVGTGGRAEPTGLPANVTILPGALPHTPTGTSLGNEEAFWVARPHLTHIRDFSRARMVAPWAVLGITLARVVALTPWAITLPPIVGGRASLNYAVAIVADSGGGKGGAEAAAGEAFTMPPCPEYRVGSGEAIAHCLKRRASARQGGGDEWATDHHNALISLPEVDKLTAQAQRTGATIMAELRSAWSGEALGHVTADPSRRLHVGKHEYRLALVLGVQPARAGGLLEDADGGFPQRLVWLPATDPAAPPRAELPECPRPITWDPPHPRGKWSIDVCEAARTAILDARERANRGQGDPLDGHLLLAREKTAAALGILDGRYEVNDEDWELAGVVIARSSHTRAGVQGALAAKAAEQNRGRALALAERTILVEERQAEAAAQRVCRVLRRKLPTGSEVSHSALRKALTSRDRQHFIDAIRALIDAGQIEWIPGRGQGSYRRVETGKS